MYMNICTRKNNDQGLMLYILFISDYDVIFQTMTFDLENEALSGFVVKIEGLVWCLLL